MKCSRCGKQFNLVTQIFFDSKTGWCKSCLEQWNQRRQYAISRFRKAFNNQVFTLEDNCNRQAVGRLHEVASQVGLDPRDAFKHIDNDCLQVVNYLLAAARSDGLITPHEEFALDRICMYFALNHDQIVTIKDQINRTKHIQQIRAGHIPPVATTIVLPSAEVCYWDSWAQYYKVLTHQTKVLIGQLVVTNAKFRFVSNQGGFEIPVTKIANVALLRDGINVTLTRTQGNGFYRTPEPVLLAEVIHAVVRIHNRRQVLNQAGSRQIPQDVKIAVWKRDGGCCTQCKSSQYLEYDHIIPFSRGGASSVNNVQLLCRKCNLIKSDKI